MRAVWERGTLLPIHVGLPGATSATRLLRVCERIRVGDSLGVLRAGVGALDGEYDPGSLVDGLDETLGDARPNLGGFHIFTFNDLVPTERWRQRQLTT
jgi:methylenetetrahydrofolate reductase (NADPH)